MGKSGAAALQEWCRQACAGYPGVEISNMSSAWRDGRGFCAVIHRYRPDVLDWAMVDEKHWARNCHLAFTCAEQYLGIPRLLDVEDVVSHHPPDRLSILTYIAQFYHKLAHSGSDSGISSLSQSPASSDSEVECAGLSSLSADRRGAILSLMDGRRVRSVSGSARRRGRSEGRRPPSPPIEQENPFIREVQTLSSPVIARHQVAAVQVRKKKDKPEPRLVQSMFIQPTPAYQPLTDIPTKPPARPRPALVTTAIPRPYKNIHSQSSVSIMSKTQTYLKERKRRSQSQPPEKRGKKKFEFLSTSNYEIKVSDTKDNKEVANKESEVNVKAREVHITRAPTTRESTNRNHCHELAMNTKTIVSSQVKLLQNARNCHELKLQTSRPFLQTSV